MVNENMKINEAIQHCEEITKDPGTCESCRQEREQLKDWLSICACVLDSTTECSIANVHEDGTAEIEIKITAASLSKAIEILERVHNNGNTKVSLAKKEQQILSNKERVLKYCRELQSHSTDWLIERDDVDARVRKYPEDKTDWYYGCPYNWGLPEFEGKDLCSVKDREETPKPASRELLERCVRCWSLALEDK